ncbi:MAG: hypothetical protein M1826_007637 [Phylliscum demangeonii]|nr:MAG: hypothetical protein M1826_007637 [Phylliscum demangeonii]
MSVPISIGDVLMLSQMAWRIGCAFTAGRASAPREFAEVESELVGLTEALDLLAEIVNDDGGILADANDGTKAGVARVLACCRQTLQDLDSFVTRYQDIRRPSQTSAALALGQASERSWRAVLLGNWRTVWWTTEHGTISDLREMLQMHASSIQLTMQALQSGSLSRLERTVAPMAVQVDEVHQLLFAMVTRPIALSPHLPAQPLPTTETGLALLPPPAAWPLPPPPPPPSPPARISLSAAREAADDGRHLRVASPGAGAAVRTSSMSDYSPRLSPGQARQSMEPGSSQATPELVASDWPAGAYLDSESSRPTPASVRTSSAADGRASSDARSVGTVSPVFPAHANLKSLSPRIPAGQQKERPAPELALDLDLPRSASHLLPLEGMETVMWSEGGPQDRYWTEPDPELLLRRRPSELELAVALTPPPLTPSPRRQVFSDLPEAVPRRPSHAGRADPSRPDSGVLAVQWPARSSQASARSSEAGARAATAEEHDGFQRALWRNAATLCQVEGLQVEYTSWDEEEQDYRMVEAARRCQIYLVQRHDGPPNCEVRYSTSIWALSDDRTVRFQQKLTSGECVVPYTVWGAMNKVTIRVKSTLKFHDLVYGSQPMRVAESSWVNYVFEAEAASKMFQAALIGKTLILSVKTSKTLRVHEGLAGSFAYQEQMCALENLRIWQEHDSHGVLAMVHFTPQFRDGYLAFYLNSARDRLRIREEGDRVVKIKGLNIPLESGGSGGGSSRTAAAAAATMVRSHSVPSPVDPAVGPAVAPTVKAGKEKKITAVRIEFTTEADKRAFVDKFREVQGIYFPGPLAG